MSDKTQVQPASQMSPADFIRHMNARHHDSLGGMTSLPDTINPDMVKTYRAFHERLHQTRLDYDHEHRSAK